MGRYCTSFDRTNLILKLQMPSITIIFGTRYHIRFRNTSANFFRYRPLIRYNQLVFILDHTIVFQVELNQSILNNTDSDIPIALISTFHHFIYLLYILVVLNSILLINIHYLARAQGPSLTLTLNFNRINKSFVSYIAKNNFQNNISIFIY